MVARMESGFVEMAANQFLPGYCILLAYPKVEQLLALDPERRPAFLEDMAAIGDAVMQATGAIRCNFAIYGNLDPFLHAHIWPRYADEPRDLATLPPLSFPDSIRSAEATLFSTQRHGELQRAIADRLAPQADTD